MGGVFPSAKGDFGSAEQSARRARATGSRRPPHQNVDERGFVDEILVLLRSTTHPSGTMAIGRLRGERGIAAVIAAAVGTSAFVVS